MSDDDYVRADAICKWIRKTIEGRNEYILRNKLDMDINNPAANWSLERSFFNGYRAIVSANRENLNLLRIFSSIFTGWFLGLRDNAGHEIPKSIPESLIPEVEAHLKEWGEADSEQWWMTKYRHLVQELPILQDLCLPKICGESGLLTKSGVLNFDTFSYAERLALLIHSGLIKELSERENPIILEIGSGFGALAYFIHKLLPNSTYICVDIPESLIFSAAYLARFSQNTLLMKEETSVDDIRGYEFVFVPNHQYHKFMDCGIEVDLAINTLSMSEMTPDQVSFYCQGLRQLLGDKGVFFEQNQDNRHLHFTYAREHIQAYFSKREEFPYELTNGKATFWTNSTDPDFLSNLRWNSLESPYQAPMLIGARRNYNIVRFQRKYYAVLHGREVDWASIGTESVDGLISADSADEAVALINATGIPEMPQLISEVGHYNIVRFREDYIVVPQGFTLDWGATVYPPGVFTCHSLEDALEEASKAMLEFVSKPTLVQTIDGYNIVSYRKRFLAIPHGLSIVWGDDYVEELPGVLLAETQAGAVALAENAMQIAFSTPSFLQVEGIYNIVRYRKHYVAVPHGLEFDWETIEDTPGIFVENSMEDAIASASNATTAATYAEPPALSKAAHSYNVVRYRGRFFAIPHGLQIDWEADNIAALPDVAVGETEQEVEAAIHAMGTNTPILSQVVGLYNVVLFCGRFFVVRQGIAVDWTNGKEFDNLGIVRASSLAEAVDLAMNLTANDNTPNLLQVAGEYNIVLFKARYFAIPHGIVVDWLKDNIADFPGVLVADNQDVLLKVLSQSAC